MDSMTIFDGLIIAIGLYTIYSTVQMKRTGDLKKGWMVGNDINMRKVKDAEGYIRYIFGKTMFIGCLTVVYGLVGIFTSYVKLGLPVDPEIIMTGIYFAFLIWFVFISVKAREEYLDGTKGKKAQEKSTKGKKG